MANVKVEIKVIRIYRQLAFICCFIRNYFGIKSKWFESLPYVLLRRGVRYRCGGKWTRIDWSKQEC